MIQLPFEMWNEIFSKCCFLSKIKLRMTCKSFYNFMYIKDLYNIEDVFLERICNDTLQQHKKITKLNKLKNTVEFIK